MELENILNNVFQLPSKSLNNLVSCFEIIQFEKGETIVRKNKIGKYFYFIKKGITRSWAEINNSPVTFLFSSEGDSVVSLNNYYSGQRGYETVEILEDSILYRAKRDDLNDLYSQDVNIANWGRKLAENELLKTEIRLISFQFLNASQRYAMLIENFPNILIRVPLKYVASYLGINQASLSRIRGQNKK